MMTSHQDIVDFPLPTAYRPLDDLLFCSNRWTNSGFLIEDNGFYPLLIGQGEIPKLWLFAKTADDRVITLVDANTEKVSKIKVYVDASSKKILAVSNTGGNLVPLAEIEYGSTPVSVNSLDLRPLGYNIQGSTDSLKIGDTTIKDNTFDHVSTMVSLGS